VIYQKRIAVSLALVLLCGCVGTNVNVLEGYSYATDDKFTFEIVDRANVTSKGMSIFEAQLNERKKEIVIDDSNPNRRVTIVFTNYYMRPGAARALVGVMAGADNITSTTTITAVPGGETLGEVQLVSKNPTATSSARSLIEQHANKIVDYIVSCLD